MAKLSTALVLLAAYLAYSGLVYSTGTRTEVPASVDIQSAASGKRLFQEHNCAACHQLFGLGGYLGPDLTRAWSDPRRGPAYLRALLKAGGSRMPDFHLTGPQVEALLAYLHYVDQSAHPRPIAATAH
ncbi:MAG: cytochrome c [Chitinophagaceae bacterium]|nr:MAG: cytochrome c [Chitinophagaceae bacterium]